jgi:hypothetical protein
MHMLLTTPAHQLALLDGILGLDEVKNAKEIDLIRKTAQLVADAIPSWPTYRGVAHLVGTSPSGKVTVYVEPKLGAPGFASAQGLIANADAIVAKNDMIFGTPGGAVNVLIWTLGGRTNGQGGALHMACNYTDGQNIELDFDDGSPLPSIPIRPSPAARIHALFEAELSECSMQNFLCGVSTGEALSRWCAMAVAGNVLTDFASANIFLGFSTVFGLNFVDVTDHTDRNQCSYGCGMAFLSWLQSKTTGGLGIPLIKIAPAMVKLADAGTLADLYAVLTGKPKASAWPDFQAAIKAAGGAAGLINKKLYDDPFNALGSPMIA